MDLKIINKKDEPLLSRVIVTAEAEFEKATPSNNEVSAKLAAALKTEEKLIVVKHIYTVFTARKAKIIAYAYSNEEELKKIEPKKKKAKKAAAEGEEPKKE